MTKNKAWWNTGLILILPLAILWATSPLEIYAQNVSAPEAESQAALLLIRDAINDIRSEISALRSDIREDIKGVNERVDSMYNLMLGGLITLIVAIIGTQWWTRIKPKDIAKLLEEAIEQRISDDEQTEKIKKDMEIIPLRHLVETERQKLRS